MLLLIFFSVIVLTVYSQTSNSKNVSTPENTTYIYCELVRHDLYLPGEARKNDNEKNSLGNNCIVLK